jgi:hypothetical protein
MAIQGTAIPYSAFEAAYDAKGMNIHGTTISVVATDKIINNVLPPNPTCADCRNQELARLTYVGKYRDRGLLMGSYTGKDGKLIRTYDVRANVDWVVNYAGKASNAAIRGNKLNNSTSLSFMHNKVTNDKHFKLAISELALVK